MNWKELIDENGKAVIPDGVSAIDENAFNGCIGLTSVEIPDSVIEIGEKAFAGCENLEEIRINKQWLLEGAEYPRKTKVMSLNGVSLAHFIEELKPFAAKCSDWKVACKLDNGKYYYINDMDEDDEDNCNPAIVLCRYSDTSSDFFTVSDLLNTDPEDFSASEVIIKHFFDKVVDGDTVFHYQIYHTIAELKTGIFFKAKDGEEDVIAFRPGFVYDTGGGEDE